MIQHEQIKPSVSCSLLSAFQLKLVAYDLAQSVIRTVYNAVKIDLLYIGFQLIITKCSL